MYLVLSFNELYIYPDSITQQFTEMYILNQAFVKSVSPQIVEGQIIKKVFSIQIELGGKHSKIQLYFETSDCH